MVLILEPICIQNKSKSSPDLTDTCTLSQILIQIKQHLIWKAYTRHLSRPSPLLLWLSQASPSSEVSFFMCALQLLLLYHPPPCRITLDKVREPSSSGQGKSFKEKVLFFSTHKNQEISELLQRSKFSFLPTMQTTSFPSKTRSTIVSGIFYRHAIKVWESPQSPGMIIDGR